MPDGIHAPWKVGCSKLTIWARPKISSKNDVRIVFIRLRTLKSDKNYLVLDANLDATKKYDFKNSFYIVYQCFKVLKPHKKRSRLESRFWTPYLKGQKHYYINASSINFINSYVIEKNVIEEALKERHLKGQSGFACDLSLRRRAVI